MKATIKTAHHQFEVNLNQSIDISLPLQGNTKNPIAWYLDAPKITPVVMGDWVGAVAQGKSSTNFFNIEFNPHAHGTHTECLGHITKQHYSIQDTLKQFMFYSKLISVTPESKNEDHIITLKQIENLIKKEENIEALLIRTLPNTNSKKTKNYSHTNPPYLDSEAAKYLRNIGIQHLLIDLPSVDKEKDNGALLAHKAFWNVTSVENVNEDARFNATITELIFVANDIIDGNYLLNIQIASFVNDASPSKPILYAIKN